MNSEEIDVFEFPTNLGLRKKKEEVEPGVKFLPNWLRTHGFHEGINPRNIYTLSPPEYAMNMDDKAQVLNQDQVRTYALNQSELLLNSVDNKHFQLMIGGDCSILLGSAHAFRRKGNYGLFFLDGHTDFVLPEGSQTKAVAGMDLAIVAGYGPERLTNMDGLCPYFAEKNIFCVANREFDEDYLSPIHNTGVNYVDLPTLRKTGVQQVVSQFLQMVEDHHLDGFFIHFDVDALHLDLMPAVDSPSPGGLSYEELTALLVPLLSSIKAVGMEITILDPTLDRNGVYTKPFVKHMLQIFSRAKESPKSFGK